MVSMAGFDLPVPVTRRYIASAITLIVHLARLKGGVRRVTRISEITALDSGDYEIQDLFGFRQTGVDERGIARGYLLCHRTHARVRPPIAGTRDRPAAEAVRGPSAHCGQRHRPSKQCRIDSRRMKGQHAIARTAKGQSGVFSGRGPRRC
jgi:hypothetical protein